MFNDVADDLFVFDDPSPFADVSASSTIECANEFPPLLDIDVHSAPSTASSPSRKSSPSPSNSESSPNIVQQLPSVVVSQLQDIFPPAPAILPACDRCRRRKQKCDRYFALPHLFRIIAHRENRQEVCRRCILDHEPCLRTQKNKRKLPDTTGSPNSRQTKQPKRSNALSLTAAKRDAPRIFFPELKAVSLPTWDIMYARDSFAYHQAGMPLGCPRN